MNQEILVRKMWKENFAYTVNAEFVPVAAYMEDGEFALPSEEAVKYDIEEAGLHVKNYVVIPAVIGEETTSLPGNHGVPVSTQGETVLEWITRIEQRTGKSVVAVTIRSHSGEEGDEPEYHTEVVRKYDFNALRDRVLDALRRSDDKQTLIECALRLSVKL